MDAVLAVRGRAWRRERWWWDLSRVVLPPARKEMEQHTKSNSLWNPFAPTSSRRRTTHPLCLRGTGSYVDVCSPHRHWAAHPHHQWVTSILGSKQGVRSSHGGSVFWCSLPVQHNAEKRKHYHEERWGDYATKECNQTYSLQWVLRQLM